MRGAEPAKKPSISVTTRAPEAAELQSLRQALADLESQILEFRKRLEEYEAGLPAAAPDETAAEADGTGPLAVAAGPPIAFDDSIREALGYGFNLAGVIALALGVAFAVRYTSGRNAAAALEAVVGGAFALFALGLLFRRRRHARVALWLEGAAVSVGYLSAYAAFSLLHSVGFVLLLSTGITAGGIALALARRSEAIAVFAVWGAVLTPLMMNGASQGQDPAAALLFAYLALISLSTLVISRLHYWPWQAASALIATHFLAWMWYGDHHTGNPTLTLLFPCVTFAVFLLRPLVRLVPAGWHDKAIAAANPVFFFLALLTLLPDAWTPLALVGVGLVLALAGAALPRSTGLAATNLALAGLCLAPGTWLLSPQLAAFAWVGIGLIAGLLGLSYSRWAARMSGYLLIGAGMALRPRAYVVVPAALAGHWLLRRAWASLPKVGDFEWLARWGLSVGTVVAGLAALTLEIRALLGLAAFTSLASGVQFFYSLGMVLYAGALIAWGHRSSRRLYRGCGWVVLAALTAKVFLLDLPALSGGWRIGSLMLLAASLLIVSAGRRREPGAPVRS